MLRFARNDVVRFASNAELKQRWHLPHFQRAEKHRAVDEAGKRARAHNLAMAARGLDFPEAFPKNEALDFALD